MSHGIVHAESNNKKIVKKNEKFTVSAEYGMGGLIYYDMPVMASVTVTSKENFMGTLQIIPVKDIYAMYKPAYGLDISLSANEAKTFSIGLSSVGNGGKIILRILDEKGKVVYEEKDENVLESGNSKVTIGILSDDYSALSYFDGMDVYVGQEHAITSIFELNKRNFPEDAIGLSMLQYMVIDNFDTSALSEQQYAALKTWVLDGGVLIVGLGSHYQNVLNCFQDGFITISLGDLKKEKVVWKDLESLPDDSVDFKTQMDANNKLTDSNQENKNVNIETDQTQDIGTDSEMESNKEEQSIQMELDCVEFEIEEGKIFSDNAVNKLMYKEVGIGRIVVLGYSMSMEPMTSSPYKQSVVKYLLKNAAVKATNERYNGYVMKWDTMYNGTDTAQLADKSPKPSALLYALILLVYVVVIGPILYLILKARNQREKIWIAIPLLSLGFTGIIYCTGFLYRLDNPLVSTFTVVQLDNQLKKEGVYTNILCPKAENYKIQFKEGYSGFKVDENQYYGSLLPATSDENSYNCMIKKNGKGTEVLFKNSETFGKHMLYVDKNSENNIGTLDSELKCYTNGFEGTVTNNTCYDLKDVVVSFEKNFCMVGDIKKGETLTIPSSKITTMNSYSAFDNLYPDKQLYKDRDMYLRYRINSVVSRLIDTEAYGKGYIWACVPSYQADIIDGSKVKQAGCGVLITTYTADYEDITGEYVPNIDIFEVTAVGDYDRGNGCMFEREVSVTYSFETMTNILTLEKIKEDPKVHGDFAVFAEVEAYNPQSGEYEPIFTDNNLLTEENLKKYLVDDVLVLRYRTNAVEEEVYIPRISAKGE